MKQAQQLLLLVVTLNAALLCGPRTVVAAGPTANGAALPGEMGAFVENNCLDCHAGQGPEAGLDLEELPLDLNQTTVFESWVKVHDKLAAGEMPPPDADQPADEERQAVLVSLAESLRAANTAKQADHGRVQFRRLNRVEYEHTLRDLLALPNLEVAGMLPPDSSAHGFDNVGAALDLSYVQMSRYLEAASEALDRAMVLSPRPATESIRLEAKTNGRLAQVLRKASEAVPIGDAVGLLRQPNTAQAPWWWSKFAPPIDGRYRIRMKTFGFIWDQGRVLPADLTHVVTFHAVQQSTKRQLASFDVAGRQAEATVHDFTAFLRQGDQIQFWLETLDDRNKGQRPLNEYTAPGVAVEWLEVEGPLFDEWPPESYRRLFGDLPSQPWTPESGLNEPPIPMITDGVGKRATRVQAKRNKVTLYHVVSQHPAEDARRLLRQFASRAFRRPVEDAELADVVALVQRKLDQNVSFQEAMLVGYQAVLCTPEFLFLQEKPGRLDDYALASRLSYFLWNSLPDEPLLELAEQGELGRTDVLRRQVERMLDDEKSQRLVESFCGQWLDLRRITITEPDEQLYPEFDQLLLDSMVKETHAYFTEMLRRDLGADYLIDSEFAMINGRLAELYDVPNVDGVEIREVQLPDDSPRGGLLTQASILKVTANGTTTSPVTRGAWVLDRIYGQPSPLPPPNVGAVEPDVRGTTTIREQLDKHRDVSSCAVCHRRIDPPGFALENFNVIGGWRERYRALEKGDFVKMSVKGQSVRYKMGLPVDASGIAPGGQSFADIHGFRRIMLTHQEQLARNLVERLLVYATGAGIEFADRKVVEGILAQTRDRGYGLRTLIHSVVQSDIFQTK